MPAERRARAVRIWAATGGLAAAAGPVVGGLLVSASWRWVFLVNIPIGLVALAFAARVVPESKDPDPARCRTCSARRCWPSRSARSRSASCRPRSGGGPARAPWPRSAVSVVTLAAFWRRSRRHVAPVVEPALLAVRSFAWSNATSLLFGVAFAGNLLVSILWMEQVWEFSALRTGLGVAPGPLMVPVFAALAQTRRAPGARRPDRRRPAARCSASASC